MSKYLFNSYRPQSGMIRTVATHLDPPASFELYSPGRCRIMLRVAHIRILTRSLCRIILLAGVVL